MKRKSDKLFLDAMRKDPQYWKGPIYVNRKDPRLIVHKQEPYLGYTLNFGSIYTYLLFAAIIAIVILSETLL